MNRKPVWFMAVSLFSSCGNFIGRTMNPEVDRDAGRRCNVVTNSKSTSVGNLKVRRHGHSLTLLSDGRVWLAGVGKGCTDQYETSTEFFNPSSGTWSDGPELTSQRAYHTATQLADGRIALIGGEDGHGKLANDGKIEFFNPTTNQLTQGPRMQKARLMHTATLLKDGRVLIAGGFTTTDENDNPETGYVTEMEIFDPWTNTFSLVQALNYPKLFHTATLLQDGRVLIAGGRTQILTASGQITGLINYFASNIAEIFDPASSSKATMVTMTDFRSYHEGFRMQDGRVVLLGGFNNDFEPLAYDSLVDSGYSTPISTTDIFDPTTNSFTRGSSLAHPRSHFSIFPRDDGYSALLFGGHSDSCYMDATIELFDFNTLSSKVIGTMNVHRFWFPVVRLQNGKPFYAGGLTTGKMPVPGAEVIDVP
jgi:hypothetical protein